MSLLDPTERTHNGIRKYKELYSESPAEPTTLLQSAVRDYAYAEVWTRPGLDRRSRLIISIAAAALTAASDQPLELYIRGALQLREYTVAELREAALHLAIYGGWSRGTLLDETLTRVAKSLGLDANVPFEPLRAKPWEAQVRHEEGGVNFVEVMVSPAPPPQTAFFEAGIINFVFGEMWMRPGLDQRSRRWITLVGVSNSAARTPIRSHVYAAMASGNATKEEMLEFVLQYAIHCGWPMASVVQGAVLEQAPRVEKGLPFEI